MERSVLFLTLIALLALLAACGGETAVENVDENVAEEPVIGEPVVAQPTSEELVAD
jgi:hypothetical protein